MPTIARFGNILVRMFADDHHPPHFHIVTRDHEALVRLSDLVVIAGSMDRRSLDLVMEWAAANRENLDNEWARLNRR